MSTAGVEHLIWELHRRGGAAEFRRDATRYLDEVITRLDVDESERSLLLQRDYPALIDHGVHPMAVLFFAQVNQVPMATYLESIGADPERVVELRRAFEAAQRSSS